MNRLSSQRVVECGEPDQRRFVVVGVQRVDTPMGDEQPNSGVCGQAGQHLGNRVGGGRLGPPRRRDDLDSRPDLVDASSVEHHNVVRPFGSKQRAGVHRRSVQRVMVTRQQIDRKADHAHGFQGLTDYLWRELIVFEDVTGDYDEFGAHIGGQRF
ncbi:Uncharacterised protein [Mycobacterium tuberculosis]|nr:Uncharacterised protein [Mycobacterium tuberculosis]CKV38185.1 Uncharacterised protein [Mycobacterium tuberculosis]CNV50931.1 Uncharacterised protein [Mycobacterium tuberculosis]COX26345.1 Uncharacterised protein [Mycobacterium tuberculosis]